MRTRREKLLFYFIVVFVYVATSVFGAFAIDETPTNSRLQFRPIGGGLIGRARNNLTALPQQQQQQSSSSQNNVDNSSSSNNNINNSQASSNLVSNTQKFKSFAADRRRWRQQVNICTAFVSKVVRIQQSFKWLGCNNIFWPKRSIRPY